MDYFRIDRATATFVATENQRNGADMAPATADDKLALENMAAPTRPSGTRRAVFFAVLPEEYRAVRAFGTFRNV